MRRNFFVRPARLANPVENLLRRVLKNEKLARRGMDVEPIHDLRTALRRCRSLAEDFDDFDPHGDWRRLRKACRVQQGGLGELRDAQVMAEWMRALKLCEGPEGAALTAEFERQEGRARGKARASLEEFSRKRWKHWLEALPKRARELAVGESRLALLVLARLLEVKALERRWRRGRSAPAWHRLRIAVKRLRYTLEALMPARHDKWATKLKRLQDRLGNAHDLDILRVRLLRASSGLSIPTETREAWLQRVAERHSEEQSGYLREVSAGPQRPNANHGTNHRGRRIWDDWCAEIEPLARVSLASAEELARSLARSK